MTVWLLRRIQAFERWDNPDDYTVHDGDRTVGRKSDAFTGLGSNMAYNVTGDAGNNTLNQSGDTGPGTIVGLAGDDSIFSGTMLAEAITSLTSHTESH